MAKRSRTASAPLLLLLSLPLLSLVVHTHAQDGIRCAALDRERVEQMLGTCDPGTDPGSALLAMAMQFLGAPYVAHTLEGSPEQLVINVDSLDCTTFVEYSLALARACRKGEDKLSAFALELERIRYRGGRLDGYASRLHYFSEWIIDQEIKGVGEDLTRELGGIPFEKKVDFMSTHPQAYASLKDSPAMVAAMRKVEEELRRRQLFFIPAGAISQAERGFRNGDVVGITTETGGLDIQHAGILVRQGGSWHLLHASSRAQRVAVSEDDLQAYLEHTPGATGIMLLRPL